MSATNAAAMAATKSALAKIENKDDVNTPDTAEVDYRGNALKENYEFYEDQYGTKRQKYVGNRSGRGFTPYDSKEAKKAKGFYGQREGDLTVYKNGEVDPEATSAAITQAEYDNYTSNIKPIEMQLLEKAKTDTSLIDQAVEDRDNSNALMTGIADRNADRYGAALTPAQRQQQERQLEMGTTLAGVQGVNDARVAQKDANRALMTDLIDIGQGVNRSSLSSLGNAAAAAQRRESAFKSARAQHKAQTYSMLGTLGAAAIFML
jgi:hypothetical protein